MVAALAGTDVVVRGGRRIDQATCSRACGPRSTTRSAEWWTRRPGGWSVRQGMSTPPPSSPTRSTSCSTRSGARRPTMKMAVFDATMSFEVQLKASTVVMTSLTETDPDDGEHVVPGTIRRALAALRLLSGVPSRTSCRTRRCCRRSPCASSTWTATGPTRSCRVCSASARSPARSGYSWRRCGRSSGPRSTRPSARSGSPVARSALRSGRRDQRVRHALSSSRAGRDCTCRPTTPTAGRTPRSSPSRTPTGSRCCGWNDWRPPLLVLFDGVPAVVHVEEPRQGVQFGAAPRSRAAVDGPRASRCATP